MSIETQRLSCQLLERLLCWAIAAMHRQDWDELICSPRHLRVRFPKTQTIYAIPRLVQAVRDHNC